MAALPRERLGVSVEIEHGDFGEFSVWADGRRLVRRGPWGFVLLGRVRGAFPG